MLIVDSDIFIKGIADTQIFCIYNENQESLLTFKGSLQFTNQSIKKFKSRQVIVYTGPQVQRIISNYKRIILSIKNNSLHALRKFDFTPALESKIIEWLFSAEEFREMR